MRVFTISIGVVIVASMLGGCASDGAASDGSASPASPASTATPAPSPSDEQVEPDAGSTAPTCEDILPAAEVTRLKADGFHPRQITSFDSGDGVDPAIFIRNGGIYCWWLSSDPHVMDSFPIYAYSAISPAEASEVQRQLLEHRFTRKDDADGLIVFGDIWDARIPGVFLFGEGVWYHAGTVEDALILVDGVKQISPGG